MFVGVQTSPSIPGLRLQAVRTRGKLEAWERDQVDAFVSDLTAGRITVMRGDLAKELRAFVNAQVSQEPYVTSHASVTLPAPRCASPRQRPLNFFEKLVSRRKLNTQLAGFLTDRIGVVATLPVLENGGAPYELHTAPPPLRAPIAPRHLSAVPWNTVQRGLRISSAHAQHEEEEEDSAEGIAAAAMAALSPLPLNPVAAPLQGITAVERTASSASNVPTVNADSVILNGSGASSAMPLVAGFPVPPALIQ